MNTSHQSCVPEILAHRGIESDIVQSESATCNGFPCGHMVCFVRTTAYEQMALKSIPSVSGVVEIQEVIEHH